MVYKEIVMSKMTFQDMFQAPISDLKRLYKMNDRQLEKNVRKHLNGASQSEMRRIYEKIWDHKGKR